MTLTLKEEWWHFTLEKEPYPDTYFTFPVNSHQVKKQTDFSEKLKKDMEFRLRFFDLMANVNQQSRLIMENAAKEVILLSQSQLRTFAEKENDALNEEKIKHAMDELIKEIDESIKNCIAF